MKKLRDIKNSNKAAAGMIVAILLIGLFFSVLAFIQTAYVPQWMEQKEAEHMEQVAAQFSQIKSSIDTLSITQVLNRPIANSITLGSKEMTFFSSSRSYGQLDFKPNEYKINIENNEINKTYSLGSIKYTSKNGHFLNQQYIYENGAIILSQDAGDVITIVPAIFYNSKDNVIEINLFELSENGKKSSASGFGTYFIQTKFLSYKPYLLDISYIQNITIYSSYKDTWKDYFNDTFGEFYNFIISNTLDNTGIKIQFSNTDNYPAVKINLVKIEVQISPGWVK